jgi:hypothetical protein
MPGENEITTGTSSFRPNEKTSVLAVREPDHPLWHAIREFPLDDEDVSLPFFHRLARDHVWRFIYAKLVVEEYRRFLFLAATEATMVTPSQDVDEAWHLHLAYTRSYWDGLCATVVGRPLHHDPAGGAEDQDEFVAAYERTLERYADVFGERPPGDIWPPSAERFAPSAGFRTVPLRDFRLSGRFFRARREHLSLRLCVVFVWIVAVYFGRVLDQDWSVYVAVACVAAPSVTLAYLLSSDVVMPRMGVPGVTPDKYVYYPQADDSKGGGAGSGGGGCGGCGGGS